MSADPVDPAELDALARNAALTRPRPGHADLVGMQKYAFDEARPVLERASARETAARVALGRVASNFLEQAVGARAGRPTSSSSAACRAPDGSVPGPDDVAHLDEDPVRCLDPDASKAMVAAIDQAHKDGDTLGGVVEVVVHGLPPGLGSHVHWDRRLDARLAGALMGIQAIKGVEVGDGFRSRRPPARRRTTRSSPTDEGLRRTSGRSGGTEGGMTTGEVLRVRAAMKPIATVPRALRTVDVSTGEETVAHHQRSDVCAVPAAGHRRRGDGGAGARRGGRREVRRRLGPGDPAQRRELPGHPEVPMTRSRTAGRARRPDGRRQDHGRRTSSRAAGASTPATPTPTWSPPRAAASPTSSSRTARRTSATLEAEAVARGAGHAHRRARAGRGSDPRPGHPRAARRPPGGLPPGRALRRREAGRPGHRPAAAARQRPRPDQDPARRAHPGLRVGRHADGRHRRPDARRMWRARSRRRWHERTAPCCRSPAPRRTTWWSGTASPARSSACSARRSQRVAVVHPQGLDDARRDPSSTPSARRTT